MLTPNERKKLDKLEKEMKMHPWKHMLILGIGFGLLVAVITAVIQMMIDDMSFAELFRRKLWINLSAAPLMAVFFGYMLRWQRIKQYYRLKEKETHS